MAKKGTPNSKQGKLQLQELTSAPNKQTLDRFCKTFQMLPRGFRYIIIKGLGPKIHNRSGCWTLVLTNQVFGLPGFCATRGLAARAGSARSREQLNSPRLQTLGTSCYEAKPGKSNSVRLAQHSRADFCIKHQASGVLIQKSRKARYMNPCPKKNHDSALLT